MESDEITPEIASKPAVTTTADVDLNDFDAYDYEQPEYDASSGLPPPEALIDAAADDDSGVEEPSAVGDEVPVANNAAAGDEAPADEATIAADEVPVE